MTRGTYADETPRWHDGTPVSHDDRPRGKWLLKAKEDAIEQGDMRTVISLVKWLARTGRGK